MFHTYTAEKPYSCPEVEAGAVGSCDERCSYDYQCRGNSKCCSNGCGHQCIVPGKTYTSLNLMFVFIV